MGMINLNSTKSVTKKIEEFISHEDYNSVTKQNDIAMIRLKRKLRLSYIDYIRPACLWPNNEIGRNRTIAVGWGVTEYAGSTSTDLMKVQLDLLKTEMCNNSFEDYSGLIINDNQICAGVLGGGRDTCQACQLGSLENIIL